MGLRREMPMELTAWPRPPANGLPASRPISPSPFEPSITLCFPSNENPSKWLRVITFITPAIASEP